jgi:hypothetical protein
MFGLWLYSRWLIINLVSFVIETWVMPWIGPLAAGLSPQSSRFNPRPVHVGFAVDTVTLEQVFLRDVAAFLCQRHSINAPCSFIPPSVILAINNVGK